MALFNNVPNSNTNNVAGIFRSAVPPGAGCFVLIRGRNILVKSAGATAGMTLVANSGSSNADASGVAIGTSAPSQAIGVATGTSAGGNTACNVDIPNIP
jgi:hypothetical protein